MFLGFDYNAAHIQIAEPAIKIFDLRCYANKNEGGTDSSDPSDSQTSSSESTPEVILDIVNNPGGSLGGDR